MRATLQLQQRCRAAINANLDSTTLEQQLCALASAHDSDSDTSERAARELDSVVQRVGATVYDAAKRVLGVAGGGGRRALRPPELSRLCSQRRHIVRLRDFVRTLRADVMSDHAVRTVNDLALPLRIDPLDSPFLPAPGCREAAPWRAWLAFARGRLKDIRKRTKCIVRSMRRTADVLRLRGRS